MSSMHQVLSFVPVPHKIEHGKTIPTLGRKKQEDQKFSYTVSSSSALGTRDISKKKKVRVILHRNHRTP